MGKYYTPKEVLKYIDPAQGTGGYLTDIVNNPPFSFAKLTFWQRVKRWFKKWLEDHTP